MTATRDQINAMRAEDDLPPAVDDTLATLFRDFKAIFGQGQRLPYFDDDTLPQFTESRPVSQADED